MTNETNNVGQAPENGENQYEKELNVKMEEAFQQVQKALKNNKFMISKDSDGIYIRAAGTPSRGEAFSKTFVKVLGYEDSNTVSKARKEMELLDKMVKDPVVIPFKDEILALVDKFGHSGQSGGSAPFTAGAISSAVKKLCMQEPLGSIYGIDEEWSDVKENGDREPYYQNKRLSSLFKEKKGCYYLNAIVFDGDIGGTFTGEDIELKDGSTVGSRQYIKSFPFKPKTFYIDVIDSRYDKDKKTGELTPSPDGDWWEHQLKDEDQLKEVFEYYDKFKH